MQQNALVVSGYGKCANVCLNNGEFALLNKRNTVPILVAGDEVIVQKTNQTFVITQLVTRKNALVRQKKVVASNLDNIILVLALAPHYQFELIDRYLVIAENLNIPISLLVNKIDLCQNKKQLDNDFLAYRDLGYQVDYVSILQTDDMSQYFATFDNKRYLLVGQSGVGKTSISNYLLPELNLKTRHLDKEQKGRHTTSDTCLYDTQYGQIIDSPGIREFELEQLSNKEIEAGFVEIHTIGKYCKFRNCLHINEPQCAVKDALELGKISSNRYQNYNNLIKNLES